MLFEIWDDDEVERELIGSCETTLSEIMVAPKMTIMATLVRNSRHHGTLKIKADPVNLTDDTIKLLLSAKLISKKYLCCGFDNPYVLIERARINHDVELAIEEKEEIAKK